MRKLSEVTATIAPIRSGLRPYARRPISHLVGHLTCLMLFKHAETERDVMVSDDNDPVGAVWLPKALISIASPDRGRFLVVMLSAQLARAKGLSTTIIDRSGFTPDELTTLNDAIAAASRSRKHLCGYREPMGWSGGRNVFA